MFTVFLHKEAGVTFLHYNVKKMTYFHVKLSVNQSHCEVDFADSIDQDQTTELGLCLGRYSV